MKSIIAATSVFFLVGCGAADPPNRQLPGSTMQAEDYPAGPYGYQMGSTIANLTFSGKVPTAAGAQDYAPLTMQTIDLATFRKQTNAKLLFMVGSARWCVPCNEEAPSVGRIAATYRDMGLATLDILAEGQIRGVGATDQDVDAWAFKFNFDMPVAIDPQFEIQQYADLSAFPLAMMVRLPEMKIAYMCVGGQCDLEGTVQSLLGL